MVDKTGLIDAGCLLIETYSTELSQMKLLLILFTFFVGGGFLVDQPLHLLHHLLDAGIVLIFVPLQVHEDILAVCV